MGSAGAFETDWLSHPKWWFDATPADDAYLTSTYGHLLETSSNTSNTLLVAKVLVHDQLARHVARHLCLPHLVNKHLQLALEALDEHKLDMVAKQDPYSWVQWTFLMLPYRHANMTSKIFEAVAVAWEALDCGEVADNDTKHLKRWIKATYQRLKEKTYGIEVFQNAVGSTRKPFVFKSPVSVLDRFRVDNNGARFLVSLSGGVDSMVCASYMCDWPECVGAVFINYNNRTECPEEFTFVKEWCVKLGLVLYAKTIKEINRPRCMRHNLRELYETYTKSVRFACYKHAWHAGEAGDTKGCNGTPNVIMGHHKGDQVENCLTNILSGSKFNDLLGMDDRREVDGVSLVRPLLPIDKAEIVAIAEQNGIPHLPDSTVSWCSRGKIRDNVLPGIEAWCGVDALSAALVKHSATCREMSGMVSVFARQFKKLAASVGVPIEDVSESSTFYRKMFEVEGLYPSNAAIASLVKRLTFIKGRWAQIEVNKKHKIEVMKQRQVIVYKDIGCMMHLI
jgi:tRNA(Ile)-lysidine synthetase-like protein